MSEYQISDIRKIYAYKKGAEPFYLLMISEQNAEFVCTDAGNVIRCTVPLDNAEFTAHMERILALSFAEEAVPGCERLRITLTDSRTLYGVDFALYDILEELFFLLREAPQPDVDLKFIPPRMQGIVACNPTTPDQAPFPLYSDWTALRHQAVNFPYQPTPAASSLHDDGTWDCACGTAGLTSKFCFNCGSPKPVTPAEWVCPNCGKTNTGKFCCKCGSLRPQE